MSSELQKTPIPPARHEGTRDSSWHATNKACQRLYDVLAPFSQRFQHWPYRFDHLFSMRSANTVQVWSVAVHVGSAVPGIERNYPTRRLTTNRRPANRTRSPCGFEIMPQSFLALLTRPTILHEVAFDESLYTMASNKTERHQHLTVEVRRENFKAFMTRISHAQE